MKENVGFVINSKMSSIFIYESILYSDLRKQYIRKYFWNRPNMIKLKELISTTNKRTIRNLSLYIEKAFKIIYGQIIV